MFKQSLLQEGTHISNPPYDIPGDRGTPQPQYSDNGAGAPMQGMPMQSMPMRRGPQNFQGHGGPAPMSIARGPSKAPGIILIVLGVLAPFAAAPILFFVPWLQGATDMAGVPARGAALLNGGTVEVDGTGSYMLQISGSEATTYKMIDSGNNVHDMSPLQSDKSFYYIDGLNNGTYTACCEGVDQKASMTGMSVSPDDSTNTVGFVFLWSTVAGVAGVALLIVDTVFVIRAGGKTKELQQQAMMLAMY